MIDLVTIAPSFADVLDTKSRESSTGDPTRPAHFLSRDPEPVEIRSSRPSQWELLSVDANRGSNTRVRPKRAATRPIEKFATSPTEMSVPKKAGIDLHILRDRGGCELPHNPNAFQPFPGIPILYTSCLRHLYDPHTDVSHARVSEHHHANSVMHRPRVGTNGGIAHVGIAHVWIAHVWIAPRWDRQWWDRLPPHAVRRMTALPSPPFIPHDPEHRRARVNVARRSRMIGNGHAAG